MNGITIENIVAVVKTATKVNIQELSKTIDSSQYNPDEFQGLVLHFLKPRAVILIFPSGKILCTGTKSFGEIEDVMDQTINKLDSSGINVSEQPEIEIQNIVASSMAETQLNLAHIATNPLFGTVQYNPRKFPGLVCLCPDPNAIIILFPSGKIVCTGVRSEQDACNAIATVKDKLSSIGVL